MAHRPGHDRIEEALRGQGTHVHRSDVTFAEQTLDDRPQIGVVGDHRVVLVVHRVIGPVGAQDPRAGGQLAGQPAGRLVAVAAVRVDVDRAHFCPNRGVVERRVGDQRNLLTRFRVAQTAAQRFALAGGGEWAKPVAVTVAAGAVNHIETGGIDGLHDQAGVCVHIHTMQTLRRAET
jgi:hypothetical protein